MVMSSHFNTTYECIVKFQLRVHNNLITGADVITSTHLVEIIYLLILTHFNANKSFISNTCSSIHSCRSHSQYSDRLTVLVPKLFSVVEHPSVKPNGSDGLFMTQHD